MKVYNTLSGPILSFASEMWTLKKRDKKRLISIQMKFFRTAGYTLFDHKRNEEISEGLKVQPVDEKLRRFKSNWLRQVTRMNNNRMTKIMLNY